jgi:hypothetical protein
MGGAGLWQQLQKQFEHVAACANIPSQIYFFVFKKGKLKMGLFNFRLHQITKKFGYTLSIF